MKNTITFLILFIPIFGFNQRGTIKIQKKEIDTTINRDTLPTCFSTHNYYTSQGLTYINGYNYHLNMGYAINFAGNSNCNSYLSMGGRYGYLNFLSNENDTLIGTFILGGYLAINKTIYKSISLNIEGFAGYNVKKNYKDGDKIKRLATIKTSKGLDFSLLYNLRRPCSAIGLGICVSKNWLTTVDNLKIDTPLFYGFKTYYRFCVSYKEVSTIKF